MKLTTAGITIIAALALTGFSPKFNQDELTDKLFKSWETHSQRDEEFKKAFWDTVSDYSIHSLEFKNELIAYQSRLGIADYKKFLELNFLLRRAVDRDSLYSSIEKWNGLSHITQKNVIEHFGSIYKEIAFNSNQTNEKLVELLGKRKLDRATVLSNLPASLEDVVETLEETEVDGFLETFYLIMLNNMCVIRFLGPSVPR